MAKKPNDEKFEITELDDASLEDVAGGAEATNEVCPVYNTGNCIAGCACGTQQ